MASSKKNLINAIQKLEVAISLFEKYPSIKKAHKIITHVDEINYLLGSLEKIFLSDYMDTLRRLLSDSKIVIANNFLQLEDSFEQRKRSLNDAIEGFLTEGISEQRKREMARIVVWRLESMVNLWEKIPDDLKISFKEAYDAIFERSLEAVNYLEELIKIDTSILASINRIKST